MVERSVLLHVDHDVFDRHVSRLLGRAGEHARSREQRRRGARESERSCSLEQGAPADGLLQDRTSIAGLWHSVWLAHVSSSKKPTHPAETATGYLHDNALPGLGGGTAIRRIGQPLACGSARLWHCLPGGARLRDDE